MLLDTFVIPVFHSRVWNLMYDTNFLRYKISLRVAQTHSRHPPQIEGYNHLISRLK